MANHSGCSLLIHQVMQSLELEGTELRRLDARFIRLGLFDVVHESLEGE